MTKDEIARYVSVSQWSSICVFRSRLEALESFVRSIYISGREDSYVVNVEIDPVDMVNRGEGWIWQSAPTNLDDIVRLIENSIGISVDNWENVSRSGKLLISQDFEQNTTEDALEKYQKDEAVMLEKWNAGEFAIEGL